MDFKVAGTYKGITSIQVDIKNDGLTLQIIAEAFEKGGRLFYLGAGTSGRLAVQDAVRRVADIKNPLTSLSGQGSAAKSPFHSNNSSRKVPPSRKKAVTSNTNLLTKSCCRKV